MPDTVLCCVVRLQFRLQTLLPTFGRISSAGDQERHASHPQLIDGGPANPKWLSPPVEGRR